MCSNPLYYKYFIGVTNPTKESIETELELGKTYYFYHEIDHPKRQITNYIFNEKY